MTLAARFSSRIRSQRNSDAGPSGDQSSVPRPQNHAPPAPPALYSPDPFSPNQPPLPPPPPPPSRAYPPQASAQGNRKAVPQPPQYKKQGQPAQRQHASPPPQPQTPPHASQRRSPQQSPQQLYAPHQPPPSPSYAAQHSPPPSPYASPQHLSQAPYHSPSHHSSPQQQSSPSAPGLLHALKIGLKTDKKTLASTSDLSAATAALNFLSTAYPAILAALNANKAAYAQLAASHASVHRVLAPLYAPSDAAHASLSLIPAASVPLTSSSHAAADAALRTIISETAAIRALHDDRVASTRERRYYAEKVRVLSAAASQKPRDVEKFNRNQAKLTELSARLDALTNTFYARMEDVEAMRGDVADQVLRAFVEVQEARLKSFGKVGDEVRRANVGERGGGDVGGPLLGAREESESSAEFKVQVAQAQVAQDEAAHAQVVQARVTQAPVAQAQVARAQVPQGYAAPHENGFARRESDVHVEGKVRYSGAHLQQQQQKPPTLPIEGPDDLSSVMPARGAVANLLNLFQSGAAFSPPLSSPPDIKIPTSPPAGAGSSPLPLTDSVFRASPSPPADIPLSSPTPSPPSGTAKSPSPPSGTAKSPSPPSGAADSPQPVSRPTLLPKPWPAINFLPERYSPADSDSTPSTPPCQTASPVQLSPPSSTSDDAPISPVPHISRDIADLYITTGGRAIALSAPAKSLAVEGSQTSGDDYSSAVDENEPMPPSPTLPISKPEVDEVVKPTSYSAPPTPPSKLSQSYDPLPPPSAPMPPQPLYRKSFIDID